MANKRVISVILGVLLLVQCWGVVEARELVRESFERADPAVQAGSAAGRSGKGWSQADSEESVSVPVDFKGVDRGAFSFDLQRMRSPDGVWGTVFELLDDRDDRLLRVKVSWSSKEAGGRPAIFVQGVGGLDEYQSDGLGLWGPVIALDRKVSVGQWLHVDLTWDDRSGAYRAFVDGKEVKARPGWYDREKKRWLPDPRAEVNRRRKERGRPPQYPTRPLGYFLSRAESLRLGNADPRQGPPGGDPSLLRNAVLDNFLVTVDEIPRPGQILLAAQPRPPSIVSVGHDALEAAGFSGKLVGGDVLTVVLEGQGGLSSTFDVARLASDFGEIHLDWKGWGIYLDEDKVFYEDDEVNLRDVEEYRVYVSRKPFQMLAASLEEFEVLELEAEVEFVEAGGRYYAVGREPVEVLEVMDQQYTIEGLEEDVPYYAAVLAAMDDRSLKPVIWPLMGLAMVEDADVQADLYTGRYTVDYRDMYPRAVVIGRLSNDEAVVEMAAGEEFEIDSSLEVAVETSESILPADEESTAEITVTVTDANGNAVSDHEIRFLLATTSEYTGVVGGGGFDYEEATGGSLTGRGFSGETDLFGRVSATYRSGFAAKTAIIVARDMVSSSTGAGYIRTFIQAAAELELEAVQVTAGKALGYEITVTSSDDWLTADGESKARITALVTRDGLPVEGHHVSFSVTAGTGSIRAVRETTDQNGKARAVYTAGKKIGIVLITATDTTIGISGSVQIELRSDAPAKIEIEIDPEILPADGHSTADLTVLVTDINDNPNEGVTVEYRVSIGSGRLRKIEEITDRDGYSTAEYVAGRVPGKVTIEVTVRSREPSDEELILARLLAVEVPDYDFF